MDKFKLVSKFKPTGDQPQAIKKLIAGIEGGQRFQTLLGVTGSGKTFSLACAIEKINQPVLVISHNKTLASQLYAEFKEFFPQNAVEYFVSYYDYYQPESYIPQTDTYIEKDASINEKLDRLRLSTTSSLSSRRDIIVVASVSCIYNIGAPENYQNLTLCLEIDQEIIQKNVLKDLISLQYERNDLDFKRSTFRVKGDTLDIFPAYRERGIRIEFFGDTIEKIYEFEPLSGKKFLGLKKVSIYPAKHFIISKDKIDRAFKTIKSELKERLLVLNKEGKLLEAQRLNQRTNFDMEMLAECGYCHGIENYSRHLSQRAPGSRPYCLIDYFPSSFLTMIDESHVTIPQIRGMYNGDRARKKTLVEHGFRLPSCLDNRPLRFDEFMPLVKKTVFVSATPGEFEIDSSESKTIEQIIRPTGLPDPKITVKSTKNQIDDLIGEVRRRANKNERTLIITLTKRMSEELSNYLKDEGLKVAYLHSEIKTLQRTKILKDLRLKKIDALIGINLLREGLDLPEVSLVAILDANKEGFLRSSTSLIQIAGRCARNLNGEVYMYADTITKSMKKAITVSRRRRKIQLAHNVKYKITPQSIQKAVKTGLEIYLKEEDNLNKRLELDGEEIQLHEVVAQLEKEMFIAAKNLHFEKATQLRDKVVELKKIIKRERVNR
ncbi:MAG: excinuclease ABC subunit UvrB [Candidatus Omnitrophica bacterium]|nr:excinuclease ABC subunit UvrB [Candidatus Omnitrophota bacterium]